MGKMLLSGILALVALCSPSYPKARSGRQQFALQLDPPVPGNRFTATLVCDGYDDYRDCVQDASKVVVSVIPAGKDNKDCPAPKFLVRVDDSDGKELAYTLLAISLHPGDRVGLELPGDDPTEVAEAKLVLPPDTDFASGIVVAAGEVSAAFPGPPATLELYIVSGNGPAKAHWGGPLTLRQQAVSYSLTPREIPPPLPPETRSSS